MPGRDPIPIIVEREGATLPEGFDLWGVKSVRPDLRTHGGYKWPFPGSVAVAENPNPDNRKACPGASGDGLCVGLSWDGMGSSQIPARTLLLVAYREAEVLGREPGKLRTRSVAVVAMVDGERLVREAGAGADLAGAYLAGADLTGAYLADADLTGAYLAGAYLAGAYLANADLTGANLTGATANKWTRWPIGFDPAANGVVTR